jgi:hypothetical protein
MAAFARSWRHVVLEAPSSPFILGTSLSGEACPAPPSSSEMREHPDS